MKQGSSFLFIAAALLLSLLQPVPAELQTALDLHSQVLVLNPEDTEQQTVGSLRWRGGLALSAQDSAFGGLSDLLIDAEGRNITAVSDSGRWLRAALLYDAEGDLSDVVMAQFGALKEADGSPLAGKRRQDAEALARFADRALVIGFERDHRLWRLPSAKHLNGKPLPMTVPPGLAGAGSNAGVEALVALADGRLLAFTEGQLSGENFRVYLWQNGKGWADLALKPAGLFRPTGATLLPSGDVMLLERRFTLFGGVGIRLRQIPKTAIKPGAVLEGREVAELRAPLTRDNFEGIAVHRAPDGNLRFTLLADDNFNALQRTLIVQFELVDDADARKAKGPP